MLKLSVEYVAEGGLGPAHRRVDVGPIADRSSTSSVDGRDVTVVEAVAAPGSGPAG